MTCRFSRRLAATGRRQLLQESIALTADIGFLVFNHHVDHSGTACVFERTLRAPNEQAMR
ncbi:MAG: hypothetical protein CMJ88_08360 [Planctomycetes bacterium]|nr:hypothetical protein [Planctomycetota bacterium]